MDVVCRNFEEQFGTRREQRRQLLFLTRIAQMPPFRGLAFRPFGGRLSPTQPYIQKGCGWASSRQGV